MGFHLFIFCLDDKGLGMLPVGNNSMIDLVNLTWLDVGDVVDVVVLLLSIRVIALVGAGLPPDSPVEILPDRAAILVSDSVEAS